MKAYGKQHMLFSNEFACAQPLQAISNSKPIKYEHYMS
jgi:hypothetical protein